MTPKLRKESKGKDNAIILNPPRSSIMDSNLNRLFSTQAQQKRYIDCFITKPLFGPRYVDLISFPYPCFKFIEDLMKQKIYGLVIMHGYFFSHFIKVFYTNMTYDKGVISSSVKGIPIIFMLVS